MNFRPLAEVRERVKMNQVIPVFTPRSLKPTKNQHLQTKEKTKSTKYQLNVPILIGWITSMLLPSWCIVIKSVPVL